MGLWWSASGDKETGFLFGATKYILEFHYGDGCKTLYIDYKPLNYAL